MTHNTTWPFFSKQAKEYLKTSPRRWYGHGQLSLVVLKLPRELAEDLTGYLPEKSIEEVREEVRARLEARIKSGSADAVSQFATFHLQMLDEPDYETAYIWFSISTALGLKGTLEARDDARDNVEEERLVELQREAGTIYESLNISLD